MKKKALSALLVAAMTLSLAACGDKGNGNAGNNDGNNNQNVSSEEFVNGKFTETRHITVEIYDRGNDGGTDPENNMYTDYIKKGMLEKHNVEVEFKKVGRWTEVDDLNNLLAAGTAPDICVTYSYPTILTYADMGGVVDLSSYVEQYKSDLPNLWGWLGDTNMLYDKDPKTGNLWAIEGKRAETQRIVTFVRQDWLDKLNMKAPTTTDEFEKMLIAFRDNAEKLLGSDADKMVPYSVSADTGWRAAGLIESFVDPNITDKDFYIYGFDDRMATQPSTKEAIRLLNKWYNEDLLWHDFALYESDGDVEDAMMKAGWVGAFTHTWDQPYRGGADSINNQLKAQVGDDANFVAIDPFTNSAGKHKKWMNSSAGDRKIFFPTTNTEVLASLLYCDFISSPDVIRYLQAGEKGVVHDVLDSGAITLLGATGDAIQNSGKNIDYTITCNGTYYGDWNLATLSLAYGYAETDPELIIQADKVAKNDGYTPKNVNVGVIEAEAGVGDTLTAKRNQMFNKGVVASVDQFDKVWDDAWNDYLSAGGQAIIDERKAKWEEFFGTATMLP